MPKDNITVVKLDDSLILYKCKKNEAPQWTYEAECAGLQAASLTLSFAGSTNYRFADANKKKVDDQKIVVNIRPFTKQLVGTATIVDEYKASTLKLSMSWTKYKPNEVEVSNYVGDNQKKLEEILSKVQAANYPDALIDATNEGTIQVSLTSGLSFVDLDFPPTDSSLYKQVPSTTAGDSSAARVKAPVEWKRTSEFMTGEIEVFADAIEPNDIRQGALGDCWFLCAISAIAEFPDLVRDLFPSWSHSVNQTGVYTVRFCKNGLWKNVRVDDFFPCYPGAGPIYSKSHGNELWVLLMEKAYAKLHGSYEAIKSGYAYEAMIDLTGAPYRIIRFQDEEVEEQIASGKLFDMLRDYDMQNFIMSASTPGEDVYTETGKKPDKASTGLVGGHAYTLIAVKKTSKGDLLVKLRNPWGHMEWTGDWSDNSSKWTEALKKEVDPDGFAVANDGVFWMSFADLVKHFVSINVCMVRHLGLHKTPWIEERRKFYFSYNSKDTKANIDGSGVSCPMFELNVETAGTYIFSIHQEDIRCAGSLPYIDAGITVLRENKDKTLTFVSGSGIDISRQHQSDEVTLSPGKYLVVPVTTGCKILVKPSVPTSAPKSPKEWIRTIKKVSGVEQMFSSALCETLEEIHARIDLDGKGVLEENEFLAYMKHVEATIPAKTLIDNFYEDQKSGLTSAGFIRSYLSMYQRGLITMGELQKHIFAMGYDEQLQFRSGRGAVVVIHGSSPHTLATVPFNADVYAKALCLPVIALGKEDWMKFGAKLYELKSGYNGNSFAVSNSDPKRTLQFTLDCSGSTNLLSHRGHLNHTENIPPLESRILHHLIPDDDTEGWTITMAMKYKLL